MASSIGSTGGTSLGQTTDVTQIFDLLESNKPEVVQDVKDLILENLNSSMLFTGSMQVDFCLMLNSNVLNDISLFSLYQLKKTGLCMGYMNILSSLALPDVPTFFVGFRGNLMTNT